MKATWVTLKEDVVIKSIEIGIIPDKVKNKPELPEGKINLVWDQMYSPTKSYLERVNEDGIDVMSPTWFQVANSKGDLINRVDPNMYNGHMRMVTKCGHLWLMTLEI